MLLAVSQTFLIAVTAPLLAGFVKRLKCQLQNRKSPPLFQPYRNLNKLFRKETLTANTASIIFRIAPYIVFSTTLLACTAIPFFMVNVHTSAIADAIVFIGLFALARFFLALAGMDIGTAFGGMGSSREMLIASLAEPALIMVIFTVAMTAASTNLSLIVINLLQKSFLLQPSLIFSAVGFALIAIAETGRIPVDNPATHLELTMIHEAMILEYSGRQLALMEWAAQIKFMAYCILFINLFFPWGITADLVPTKILFSCFAMTFKMIILCIALAITEINFAKLRLFRAPYLLNLAFLFCLLGLIEHIILEI